jgi:hypothetical protein
LLATYPRDIRTATLVIVAPTITFYGDHRRNDHE